MFRVIFTVFVTIVVAYLFLASMSGCASRRARSDASTEMGITDPGQGMYGAHFNWPKVIYR